MYLTPPLFGALTAKPYAFSARPWELLSRPLWDPLDSLATPIRVDLRGPTPLRTLPRVDPANPLGEWVSDRTRFAYDGFRRQRLASPLIRSGPLGSPLRPSSWQEAFHSLAALLGGSVPPTLVAGPFLGLAAFRTQQRLAAALGLRSSPPSGLPPRPSGDLAAADLLLLVGCDLRLRLPLVHLRLRRLALAGVPLIQWGSAPASPGFSLGHRPASLVRLFQGRHRAAPLLAAARAPLVLVGEVSPPLVGLAGNRWPGRVHSLAAAPLAPAQALLGQGSVASAPPSATPPPLWLAGADGWDWAAAVPAVVYQGHHGDRAAARASLVLPTLPPFEEKEWRRDLWGRSLPPLSLPPNPLLPSADQLLRAAGLLLGPPLPPGVPPFPAGGEIALPPPFPSHPCRLGGGPFYPAPANPYRLDVISRASRPLALAARRLLPSAPNYLAPL